VRVSLTEGHQARAAGGCAPSSSSAHQGQASRVGRPAVFMAHRRQPGRRTAVGMPGASCPSFRGGLAGGHRDHPDRLVRPCAHRRLRIIALDRVAGFNSRSNGRTGEHTGHAGAVQTAGRGRRSPRADGAGALSAQAATGAATVARTRGGPRRPAGPAPKARGPASKSSMTPVTAPSRGRLFTEGQPRPPERTAGGCVFNRRRSLRIQPGLTLGSRTVVMRRRGECPYAPRVRSAVVVALSWSSVAAGPAGPQETASRRWKAAAGARRAPRRRLRGRHDIHPHVPADRVDGDVHPTGATSFPTASARPGGGPGGRHRRWRPDRLWLRRPA
jgi:hypothetical protein